jgi:hypothetical protein
MDRLSRVIAGGTMVLALGVVASTSGCRSAHNDVPPGKPFSTTGGTPPTVGFSSDPRPSTTVGPGLYGNAPTQGPSSYDVSGTTPGSGMAPQLGTPTGSGSPYGAPTANRYGSLGAGAPVTNPAQ